MLSLTFKKPAPVKDQNSAILVSFTADVLSGAENNTKAFFVFNFVFKKSLIK